MSLWNSQYRGGVQDLLQGLDAPSIYALATTASNRRITPSSTREAIEVILRYTENLPRFFSYRKINAQVLFEYLNRKKVPVRVGESTPELQERVKKEWEKSVAKKQLQATGTGDGRAYKDFQQEQASTRASRWQPAISSSISISLEARPTSTDTSINLNVTSPQVHLNLEVNQGRAGSGIRSDVFVEQFCRWFYTMLNRLQPEGASLAGDTFSPDCFVANCCVDIYLCGPQTAEKHALGHINAYQLMKAMCTDHRLSFVPCLDTGVRAEMSEHGLLKLFCCGTLHQVNSFVGVFEQEFGLVKCPEGKWRIAMTKINLKHAQTSAALPVLDKGPLFEIV